MAQQWHISNGRQVFLATITNAFATVGQPLAAGTVGIYSVGTLNPVTTYSDNNGATPNANPLTLDSAGTASIFGQGQVRQIVKDSGGNVHWDANTESSQIPFSSASIISALGYTPLNQAGDNMAGALNLTQVTIASANGVVHLDTAAGDVINYTGTNTATAFGGGAQVGSRRILICAGAAVFANSANILMPGGITYTAKANDILEFICTSTGANGIWRCNLITQSSSSGGTSGSLLKVESFTGNGTWTKAAGVNAILIQAVGGGGGGAGCNSAGSQNGKAGGGGGGQFAQLYKTSPAASYAITIGAAGVGATTNADGGAGGNTTVGAILTANGGSGGVHLATSGNAGAANGGAGGTGATSGDISIDGQPGGLGFGGAAGAGPWVGGYGGSSMFGPGALGTSGGSAANAAVNGSTPSGGFGGGGSGGANNGTSGVIANGGNGTAGLVVIYSYS